MGRIVNPVGMSVPGVAWMSEGGRWTGIEEGEATGVLTSVGNNIIPVFKKLNAIAVPVKLITHAMSPYVVLSTDYFLKVDSSAGVVSLLFPDTATSGIGFVIKDFALSSFANNITLTSVSGLINFIGTTSSTSYIFNINGQAVNILGDSSNYLVY